MEPITFELFDGYKDDKGVVHKTVVMRRLTMKDQLALLGDTTVKELVNSGKSVDSSNRVERNVALIELQKFNIILFGLLIESLGSLSHRDVLNQRALEKLTVRDINLITLKHQDASIRVVTLDLVERAIKTVVTDDETRALIFGQLGQNLGE